MQSNKLSLNVIKTQTIPIGGRKKLKDVETSDPQNLRIAIDQKPVSKIKQFRYLGIEVGQFLSWEGHISALIKTTSREIGMLRHGKRYFSLTTVQSMYKSIIELHFRFCCSVWGVCSATALNKQQRRQNLAARIATGSPYDAPSQPLLEKLGWQTIRELVDMKTATMVYRLINNEAPDYISTLLERLSQNTIKELRSTKTDLKLPLLKTSNG